jgi:hypothetical protein
MTTTTSKSSRMLAAIRRNARFSGFDFGAGDGARTRDLELGKLRLCQLSYARSQTRILTYAICERFSVKMRTNDPVGPRKYAVPRIVTGYVDLR